MTMQTRTGGIVGRAMTQNRHITANVFGGVKLNRIFKYSFLSVNLTMCFFRKLKHQVIIKVLLQ